VIQRHAEPALAAVHAQGFRRRCIVFSGRTLPTRSPRQLVARECKTRGAKFTLYYGWRPNLPDEADNHLIEFAVAAGAQAIVTHSIRDVGRGEMRWQTLEVLTPAHFLERYP
jgi:hypothetical protein